MTRQELTGFGQLSSRDVRESSAQAPEEAARSPTEVAACEGLERHVVERGGERLSSLGLLLRERQTPRGGQQREQLVELSRRGERFEHRGLVARSTAEELGDALTRAEAVVARAPSEPTALQLRVNPAPVVRGQERAGHARRLVEGERRRTIEREGDAAQGGASPTIGFQLHAEERGVEQGMLRSRSRVTN